MTPAKVFSLIAEMVGRPAIRGGSPTAPAAAADLLEIAERWSCWRLKSETTREHQHRLQLHLHTLAIAIEDDLTLLDQFERSCTSKEQVR